MSYETEILAAVAPNRTLRDKIEKSSKDLMDLVNDIASTYPIELEVRLVGSVAKDTYLGDPDIDVFILFPEDTPRATLEDIGLSIGRKAVVGEGRYAEHPYIHGLYQGYQVDLVPCYKLADANHIKSAVDRTPFHTEYILSHLTSEQHDQVRLLKQFMKGVGVYGADAKVCGFSGYLAELLILRYGDFKELVSAAAAWTSGTALSLDNMKNDSFRATFVFIDPVDSKRNVASALSVDSFATFVYACGQYLISPDRKFFFPVRSKALSIGEIVIRLKEMGTKVVIVRTARPDLTDDNLYPQAQKTIDGLKGLLEQHGFRVVDHAYVASDKMTFVIMLEDDRLSACALHQGPPVWVVNSERFLERWKKEGIGAPFIKDGNWVVMAEREYVNASDLLVKRFKEAALGSAFRKIDQVDIFDHSSTLTPGFEDVLSKLLDKRFTWER